MAVPPPARLFFVLVCTTMRGGGGGTHGSMAPQRIDGYTAADLEGGLPSGGDPGGGLEAGQLGGLPRRPRRHLCRLETGREENRGADRR